MKSINPFSDDDAGHRMMSVLCLIAAWESNLANSLFSALGIRVVHSLHPTQNQKRHGTHLSDSGGLLNNVNRSSTVQTLTL